ncbi:hypothetical protein JHK85_043567 [Glycine max]|nr:hypothetical protein JHK85_043567 [Glycine max]
MFPVMKFPRPSSSAWIPNPSPPCSPLTTIGTPPSSPKKPASSTYTTPFSTASISQHPFVLAVFEDRRRQLHATRSPQFLGLRNQCGLWSESDYGSDVIVGVFDVIVGVFDVIVGVFDTGVWPEHRSFSDLNLGPIPRRWKGTCETNASFSPKNYNRKFIGARFFSKGHEAEKYFKRGSHLKWPEGAVSRESISAMKKLGHLKDEVRNATKFDLPNKDRKDSQGICFLGKRKYMLRKVTIQLKLVEGDSAGTIPFLSQCIELFSSADNPICINELNITSLGIMEIPICLGGSISSIGSTLYVLIFLLISLSSVEVPVLCSPVPFQNYALSSLDLDQVYIELKLDGLFCSHVCFVVW